MLKPIGTVFIVGRLRRVCRQDRRGKRRQDHRRRLDRCLRQHRHVRFHRSADGSRRTDPGRSAIRQPRDRGQGAHRDVHLVLGGRHDGHVRRDVPQQRGAVHLHRRGNRQRRARCHGRVQHFGLGRVHRGRHASERQYPDPLNAGGRSSISQRSTKGGAITIMANAGRDAEDRTGCAARASSFRFQGTRCRFLEPALGYSINVGQQHPRYPHCATLSARGGTAHNAFCWTTEVAERSAWSRLRSTKVTDSGCRFQKQECGKALYGGRVRRV